MIKATYDTNILASGTTIAQGPASYVLDAWIKDEVEMITSKPLIDELKRTLTKSYFTSRLKAEQIHGFIDLVKTRATVVEITTPIPKMATHPEDDIVLATAESGKVGYIVTGDHGLQDLQEYKGIQIVNARTFAGVLQEKQNE